MDAADAFGTERPRLLAIAYRMLGTMSDAEDAVQECFLRVREIDPATLDSPQAFFTTVVTRVCLDLLKSARMRRETYPGPWLPEPVRTEGGVDTDSIAMAFLVILETLSPEERAVYLLCEVFDYSHREVAGILDKSEEACRQLLHRARKRVADGRPRFRPVEADLSRIVNGFLLACRNGEVNALQNLLADDVVATSDGGGKAPALRKPIEGIDAVARFFGGLARQLPAGAAIELAEMNGDPAVIIREGGEVATVIVLEIGPELKIRAIRSIRNPEKLTRI